ncbi:thermonuclease family protein [Candidatus Methylobacter oryzae]|uniref:thermonuclease family protein n=1 Tax=Candidatus Methylobacter oryzae TaxID=2497749 RepID=UPI0030C7BD3D
MKIRILWILLLSLSGWAHAEIYQWQDADGRKHFSDRPVADAKVIDEKILDIKPAGHEFFRVKTVYDGDTVVLEDGRRIRLLGINTPEIRHRDKPADAGGYEAKRWLVDKLQDTKVRLEAGAEKTDDYGRMLAHLFTENKEHINLQLVAAGLASVSIFPPNLLYESELVQAQEKAERAKLGIWGRPEYATMPAAGLTEAGHPGWTRLVGKVVDIRNTGKSVYLKFSDMFDARIQSQWLDLFPDVNDYLGKNVEVRGWLNKNKGHWTMLIRHPSSIKRLSE